MKHLGRLSASLVLAAAFSVAVSAPAAASAYAGAIYPPSDACSITPAVITAGSTVEFSCESSTFSSNESVTITVEGATGAEIGFIRFAVTSSGNATSTDSGALDGVTIAFPSDANGIYNIAAVSATSAGGTASATVSSAAGAGGAANAGGLPVTGMDSGALVGLWVGGGALVLAGAAIAVAAAAKRRRNTDA